MQPISKRDTLIETALKLFSENGFHATGIDAILVAASVARMTLYHHFGSKQDLILAVIDLHCAEAKASFEQAVAAAGARPLDQMLAPFTAFAAYLAANPPRIHRGCLLVNAAAEFSNPADPVHRAVSERQHELIALHSAVARRNGCRDPDRLAIKLALVMDGAKGLAQITGDPSIVDEARQIAAMLVEVSLT